jgi:hypothetical protein
MRTYLTASQYLCFALLVVCHPSAVGFRGPAAVAVRAGPPPLRRDGAAHGGGLLPLHIALLRAGGAVYPAQTYPTPPYSRRFNLLCPSVGALSGSLAGGAGLRSDSQAGAGQCRPGSRGSLRLGLRTGTGATRHGALRCETQIVNPIDRLIVVRPRPTSKCHLTSHPMNGSSADPRHPAVLVCRRALSEAVRPRRRRR